VKPLRIATRRSALALWQAEHVKQLLVAAQPEREVTLLPLLTQGDRITDRSLAEFGGKGLFIRELELALADGRAELAVHSMKDLPYRLEPGFTVAAVLPRADARDALVSNHYASIAALPAGARVGTSSLRRQCLLRAMRPDLELVALRGNVDTRLRKLDDGDYAAIVLAAAGLIRLGLASRITAPLDPHLMVPAPCQGIIAIEAREGTDHGLASLEHGPTRLVADTERAFAAALSADCTAPLAAHAELQDEELLFEGLVGSPDGRVLYRDSARAPATAGAALGASVARRLIDAGAGRLLAALRAGRTGP
jgi:hydroxymethylbilane synthase